MILTACHHSLLHGIEHLTVFTQLLHSFYTVDDDKTASSSSSFSSCSSADRPAFSQPPLFTRAAGDEVTVTVPHPPTPTVDVTLPPDPAKAEPGGIKSITLTPLTLPVVDLTSGY